MWNQLFRDSFWNEEITVNSGFENLAKGLKEGRQLCKDVLNYCQQRSKTELKYAKELEKLSKVNMTFPGSLGQSFTQLLHKTRDIAALKREESKDFEILATEMKTELDTINFQTKQKAEQVTSLYQEVLNHHNKVFQNKKHYENNFNEYQKQSSKDDGTAVKCMEKTGFGDEVMPSSVQSILTTYQQHGLLEATVANIEVQMIKVKDRTEKAKKEWTKSDEQYKNSIIEKDESQQKWEAEFETSCDFFQEIEMRRIDYTRDLLWKCTNITTICCVKIDECCEDIRLSLEKCSIPQDIQEFVFNKKTGGKRPEFTKYEACDDKYSLDDNDGSHVYSTISFKD